VELDSTEVTRILGIKLPNDEIGRTLRALEFQVEGMSPGRFRVMSPPHRLDIQTSADLIEELVRIHGYERLPATLLHDQLPEQVGNRSLDLEEHVRDLLVNMGLQEVITYSLTEPSCEEPLIGSHLEYIRLANPISSERVVMRQSLLASVLEIASANSKHTEDIQLFEIGVVYLPRPGDELPDEPRRLAIVMIGKRVP